MYTLRRWWDRHRLQMIVVGVAVGTAVLVRQTQASFVFEVYRVLSSPFHPSPVQETLLVNAKTQELQQRLIELENQNQRLKELLGYTAANQPSGIAAPVIGRSSDHWWQQVILGRGSDDGVQVGYVVMAPGGVVGRVTNVTAHTSRVLLLSDPSSRIGVTISRSRSMGYLRGQSTNRAIMEFFDKVPDVRRGDTVSTSAFSQLFPAGSPVGRIESVDLNKSPAPEAVIELSAPVNALEWAVVYPHSPSQQPAAPTQNPGGQDQPTTRSRQSPAPSSEVPNSQPSPQSSPQ